VPSDEEVMATQLRDPARVWSVQVEAPKAADGMSAETAFKKMKKDAKRRAWSFIARKNCAAPEGSRRRRFLLMSWDGDATARAAVRSSELLKHAVDVRVREGEKRPPAGR